MLDLLLLAGGPAVIELDPDSPEWLALYEQPAPDEIHADPTVDTQERLADLGAYERTPMPDLTAAERIAEHTGRIESAPTASVEGAAWAEFLDGVRTSDVLVEYLFEPSAANLLGAEIGWVLRGRVALDPSLQPILDYLTKELT